MSLRDYGIQWGTRLWSFAERTPAFVATQVCVIVLTFWVTVGQPFTASTDGDMAPAPVPSPAAYSSVGSAGQVVPSVQLLAELNERYAWPAFADAVAPAFATLYASTGFHHSIFAFIISLLLNLLLAPLVTYVPSVALRHAYSILTGLGLMYLSFGVECLAYLLPCAAATYILMVVVPSHCGMASFALNFGSVIYVLKFRDSDAIWRAGGMDFTGTMMLFVLGMVSICFNYQDGLEYTAQEKRVVAVKPSARPDDESWRSDSNLEQRKHHLVALPSVLEFASYAFGLGCRLSGPTWEYSDFILWFERKPRSAIRTLATTLIRLDGYPTPAPLTAQFDHNVWDAELPQAERAPSALFAAARKFAVALCFIAAHSLLLSKFALPVYGIDDPLTGARGDADRRWFAATWAKRACWLGAHSMIYRTKYCFAWGISDMAFSLAGFGFSGWRVAGGGNSFAARGKGGAATGSVPVWHRACNSFPLQVELSPSLSKMVTGWNLTTSYWLRCYVYNRMWRRAGTKRATTWHILVTQVVSAVWHGMKWGNVAFFFMSVWQISLARIVFKRITRPLSQQTSLATRDVASAWLPIVDFIHWFWSYLSLGFFSFPFIVMEVPFFTPVWFAASSLPFWIIVGGGIVLDKLFPARRKKSTHEKA